MITTLYLNAESEKDLEHASELLLSGQLVAFPTETVYGLGALAFNESSVKKVFEAKNRPTNNPLIVHIGSLESAFELFDLEGCEDGELFAKRLKQLCLRFWPGPLTIVGKKTSIVSDLVTSGFEKVAVRLPAHPAASKLLQLVGSPLVAPSANPFTRPSPTSARHVMSGLNGTISAVLDGGCSEFGIESTVIEIDGKKPRILRYGVINTEEIEQLLNEKCLLPPNQASSSRFASPGLTKRHYSPDLKRVELASKAALAKSWFSSNAIILRKESEIALSKQLGKRNNQSGFTCVLPDDPSGFAKELFAAFYDMESKKPHTLLVEDLKEFSNDSRWLAVLDKLARAQNTIGA